MVGFIILGYNVNAQSDSTKIATKPESRQVLSVKDSLMLSLIQSYIKDATSQMTPRYKLYKTDNVYNLILLDTAAGRLWQVQYGMNEKSNRMIVPIDDNSLLWSFESPVAGRFELYPTNNMYTFILVDTQIGRIYQVQWSTNSDQKFRIPIHYYYE